MEVSLADIVKMVRGSVVGDGHGDIKIKGTCAISNYMDNRISFARTLKFGEKAADLKNAILIIPQDLVSLTSVYPQNTYIVVEDVDKSMMDIQDFFYKDRSSIQTTEISPSAWVARSARLGEKVRIGENVYIGENSVIGDGTEIMSGAYIGENVIIGKRTCIHPLSTVHNGEIGDDTVIRSGARLGVDGFRFAQNYEAKRIRKMIHVGSVKIGSRVEIGANTAIQRSTFEGSPTTIGDDVKIACTIVIGHNSQIGNRTIITCHVMVCGSNHIGEDVWIGACAVISNGVSIGNRAKVLINAVVVNDVPEDGLVSGFYAMPHRQWKKVYQKMLESAEV